MHNGAFKTLKEVIDFYDNPFATVTNPINIDETLKKPLGLTKQEKEDLLNFLLTLTDKKFKNRN
jgi:cytochrome c peroxidase